VRCYQLPVRCWWTDVVTGVTVAVGTHSVILFEPSLPALFSFSGPNVVVTAGVGVQVVYPSPGERHCL
jgi:hypothetical protein